MKTSDLDESLKTLLISFYSDEGENVPPLDDDLADILKAIKKTFQDAHWEPIVVLNRDESFKATGHTIYKTATLMTKEEWEARAKDAGYVWIDPKIKQKWDEYDKALTNVYLDNASNLMSGKEWCEKLKLSVDVHRYHESDPEYTAQQEVLRAAEKIARLIT